ncbi:transposase, partial [bacterium]|nr:transposase [bacterium]
IMPNHIHGIINIAVGAIPCNRPIPYRPIKNNKNHTIKGENTVSPLRKISNRYNGLGQYVSWFKRMTTNKYIHHVKINGWESFNKRLWQRNYYDHIIRNEKSLQEIREYIINNPATWADDENNISLCSQ